MNFNSGTILVLSRYVAYLAVFICSILFMNENLYGVLFFSFLFVIILLNSSVRIKKFYNQHLKYIISIFFEIALVLYMSYRFNTLIFICLYIITVDIHLQLEFKQSVFMSIVVLLSILGSVALEQKYIDINNLIVNGAINAAVMVFFAGAAYMVKFQLKRSSKIQELYDELKKSKDELEEANFKLSDYSKKVEDITVINERNRMAGEIHDTIGHSLTALIMELDICRKLIDKDVEKTKAELKKASDLARNALTEVRMSVRAIKPQNIESLSGIKAVEELIRDFEKNTGIIVKLNVSKNQYKLSPAIEVTIYRAIQEALTNCARYGQADIAFIDLLFHEGSIEVDIKDNGPGSPLFTKGIGLQTMEERIHYLGGKINFSGEKGFKINIQIPVGGNHE